MAFDITPTPDALTVGEIVRYDVRLNNRSSVEAKSLLVTVQVPAGLRVDPNRSSGWKEKAGRWSMEFASLPAAEKLAASITLVAEKPGPYQVSAGLSGPDLAGDVSRTEPIRVYDIVKER